MPILEAAAGASAGVVSQRARAGAAGQHDQRRAEHLLGGVPPDRRMGRCPRLRRHHRSVVRPTQARGDAALERALQTPHPLSTRDRLAGAQAGRIRGVSLPVRAVSDEPFSHGLRLSGSDGVGRRGPRVPRHPAPGGTAERSAGGRGVAAVAGSGPGRERGPSRDFAEGGTDAGAGAGGERRTDQPIDL